MGTVFLPGARSRLEARAFIGIESWPVGMEWVLTDEGMLFVDPLLTDAEAEALYAGFVPSGETDEVHVLPQAVKAAGRIVRQMAYASDADLAAMTTAEERRALRALARVQAYLFVRLDELI